LLAPIRWFGRNSYEVYLTHMMVIFAVLPAAKYLDAGNRWVILWYSLMITAAGIFGWCIAHFYSEPMNRRLRRSVGIFWMDGGDGQFGTSGLGSPRPSA